MELDGPARWRWCERDCWALIHTGVFYHNCRRIVWSGWRGKFLGCSKLLRGDLVYDGIALERDDEGFGKFGMVEGSLGCRG